MAEPWQVTLQALCDGVPYTILCPDGIERPMAQHRAGTEVLLVCGWDGDAWPDVTYGDLRVTFAPGGKPRYD